MYSGNVYIRTFITLDNPWYLEHGFAEENLFLVSFTLVLSCFPNNRIATIMMTHSAARI